MSFSVVYVEFSEVFNESKATLAWINSLQFGGGQVSGIVHSNISMDQFTSVWGRTGLRYCTYTCASVHSKVATLGIIRRYTIDF